MSDVKYKYMCPTPHEDVDTPCKPFRQSCTLCNCAPFQKMVLDPGKVITTEPQDMFCPFSGQKLELKDIVEDLPSGPTMIIPMNRSQIQIDRKKRSHRDFVKNVLPHLPADEQRHHVQKGVDFKPTVDIRPGAKKKK